MTARTRKATSTAKKTTAAKDTRKTSSSRPTRKTPAKKAAPSAPRLSLVKPAGLRPNLPTRHRAPFMTDTQGFAVLAARIANIPTWRINDWRDHHNGTCTRPLHDGTLLHYRHDTRTLTWHAPCPTGAVHQYRIDSPSAAVAARIHVERCRTKHADLTHIPALTDDELTALGLHTGPTLARPDLLNDTPTETIPVPLPDRQPRALGDQLTRTHADTTETQPIPRDEIAAGLAARADQDTPKEHPEP